MTKLRRWCGFCCHHSPRSADIKKSTVHNAKPCESTQEPIRNNHNTVTSETVKDVLPTQVSNKTHESEINTPATHSGPQHHVVKFAETTVCKPEYTLTQRRNRQSMIMDTSNSRVKIDFTTRPSWTLQDILDGPTSVSSDPTARKTRQVSNEDTLQNNKSDKSLLNNSNPVPVLSPKSVSVTTPPHHHTPTFFLPRISTDPTDGYMMTRWYESNGTMANAIPIRRGSMIVRSGRTTSASSQINTPESGIQTVMSTAGLEGFIVTPFAQILVSMQRIRNSFIRLTNAQSSHRFGVASSAIPEPDSSELLTPESPDYKLIANETVEELEWCLKQLENIQTKRPVSDMAFSKFKRLLNKELNSFGEADKSRHEISAYICGTFLEDEKDAQANQEIEQMLERRRSSGQSHCSASPTDQSTGATTAKSAEPHAHNSPADIAKSDSNTHARPHQRTAVLNDADQKEDNTHGDCRPGEPDLMPINGIVTQNDKELDERFTQTLDTWGADIFEIDRLSDGHALTTTAYRIFQKRDLLRIFDINPARLVRYLLRVESNYHSDVPYHNALHAADVTQTSHFLLQAEPLEDVFSDLEILAVIFASAVHDVDHPGLTNQFLINTGHDLALQYNDVSVLENHHLYVAFKLLNEPDCDIFASLSGKKRQTLRRMVIELVLATDMSKHMSLLADLRTMVETKKVSGSGVLNLDNYSDRIQILQNMIHCADLSNPAKPLRLNRKWTGRLMEEFFRQGDKERKLKLEISPMCDRESVAVEKSQVSFIDFVAHPLLESWCDLVHPSAQMILDILGDNRDWYESQSESHKTSGANKGRPKLATAKENDEDQAMN